MERTLFTNRWYALKPSRLVKRVPIEVPILGHNAVVWRTKENQIALQSNVCPHRGAKLSMGKVSEDRRCIECPYHGWQFDNKGKLVDIPSCDAPGVMDNVSIDTWQTVESGGLIWFCTGPTCTNNPPIIKEMHNSNWVCVTGQDVFQNDWITTLENSIDITHVNFVHSDFGDANNGSVKDIDVTVKKHDHLVMHSTIHHKSDNVLLKFTERPDVRVRHDILLPNTVSIQFWIQNILNVITYVTYTPLSNNQTLINWVFLRHPRLSIVDPLLDYFFIEGMQRAISEDKAIVNSLKSSKQRVSVPPDIIQNKFRSMLTQLRNVEPSTEYGDIE